MTKILNAKQIASKEHQVNGTYMFNATYTIIVGEGFSLPLEVFCCVGRFCQWRAKARRYIVDIKG